MKIDSTLTVAAQTTRLDRSASAPETAAQQRPSPGVEALPSSSAQMSVQDSRQMVESLNAAFELAGNQVQFKLDEDAGKMVFYLKDAQTGETLRQIPDETVLRISKNIATYLEEVQTDLRQPGVSAQLSGLITDARA